MPNGQPKRINDEKNSSSGLFGMPFAAIIIACIALAISGVGIWIGTAQRPKAPEVTSDSSDALFQDCIQKQRTPNSNEANAQNIPADLCYLQVSRQLLLRDFVVRQQMFSIAQQENYRVTFVSLVILLVATTSGIILAGLQMLASFKLMSKGYEQLGTNTELVVKYNSLALRSSAVGVSIFGISMLLFAFFIYLTYIASVPTDSLAVERAVPELHSPPQPAPH